MECTLATILACFSWSNVYVDATTTYIDPTYRDYTESFYGEALHVFTEDGREYIQLNKIRKLNSPEREVVNPYLRGSLGYSVDVYGLRLDLSAFYQESVRAHDDAEIGAAVRVRWFPFR